MSGPNMYFFKQNDFFAEKFNSIDSAEWYENEGECGAAIKAFLEQHKDVKRSDIFFTTKLRENVSYEATRASIKKSLKDSGLDYLDMYLLHAPYGGQRLREACYKAVLDAVDDGEVKVAGVSNFGVSREFFICPPCIKTMFQRNLEASTLS